MEHAATHPAAAAWPSASELAITWGDGHVSTFAMVYLRRHCPCATCKAEQAAGGARRDLLRPEPTPRGLESPDVAVVGRYALRFGWRDGHDTGIYPFTLLRELCPCATCRGG
jgi:DUF971 family protein